MRFVACLLVVELLKAHALTLTTRQNLQHQGSSGDDYYKQPLKNSFDMSYAAEMKVGGQTMFAILDTGSFDVEVVSKRCGHSCHGAGSNQYYDRDASTTYVEGDLLHVTSYGSGDVYAQSATDTMKFGDLTIKEQVFWEVVDADLGGLLEAGDFQAIVGVGPPSWDLEEVEYESKGAKALKQKFHKLHFKVPDSFSEKRYMEEVPNMKAVVEMLGTKRFSVCLGWKPGSEGYFVWNDPDPSENIAFQELSVAGNITWGLELSNVVMKQTGGKAKDDLHVGCGGSKACAAIVDSGTSLLTVPTAVYDSVLDYLVDLGASCEHMDRLPPLVFELGGKTLSLPPSSYMGYVESDIWMETPQTPHASYFPFLNNQTRSLSGTRGGPKKSCELLIGKMDVNTNLGPMWILGMPFFRKYYTTFELGNQQRNSNSRQMFVAEVDDSCVPQKASGLDYTPNRNHPVTAKPKHLKVPKWAVKALKKGNLNV
jgi:hypothetical protein